MRLAPLLAAALCALLPGCYWKAAHGEHAWYGFALELEAGLETEVPHGAADVLAGRPEPGPARGAQEGDRLLYAVTVMTPQSSRQLLIDAELEGLEQRVLDVEGKRMRLNLQRKTRITFTGTDDQGRVTEHEQTSAVQGVAVRMHDADGTLQSTWQGDAMVDFLGRDAFAAAMAIAENERLSSPTDEQLVERRQLWYHWLPAVFALQGILAEAEPLRGVALKVAGWTLGFTALWNFGIHMTLGADPGQSVPGPEFEGGPTCWVPIWLDVNDRPAVRALVRFARPRAPLGVAAGIVEVVGFRASDPRYRFHAELVAWDLLDEDRSSRREAAIDEARKAMER